MRTRCRRGDIVGFALILSISATLFAWTQLAYSADGENWVLASAVHVEKQADVIADEYNTIPAIPCETQTFSKKTVANKPPISYTACAVAMQDAYFENNATLPGSFRSFSTDTTLRLDVPNLANPRIFAVPNSRSFVLNSWAYQNYQSLPAGLHIIRDYQNTLSEGGLDSYGNKTYTPTKPFDFELRDPSGALVPIAQNGLKFSTNGQWMIFRLTYNGQSAWARLNLDTYELLSFATPVQSQFAVYDAISNDGRYAVLYESQATLRVYDLERCGITVNKFQSHQCAYTDLYSSVKSTLGANEIGFKNFRFTGDKKISFYATTRKAGEATWSYGDFTMHYGDEDTSNGYLAMGDSFSSGEGAYDYRPETDFFHADNDFNLCHQSRSSYPYLLNKMIGFDWFGSVACSGAKIENIAQTPQAKDITDKSEVDVYKNFLPGYLGQKHFIAPSNGLTPKVVTLTITGNNIGFADILSACVHPINHFDTCYSDRRKREQLANLIDSKIAPLTELLKTIKGGNERSSTRLYMIGYPKVFNEGGICGLNADMNMDELKFADVTTEYLNRAIELASNNAGVQYINVADSFLSGGKDYRLCGNQKPLAVNGLVLLGNTSKKPDVPYYQESFHPNELGNSLLAYEINKQTNGLVHPMPQPVTTPIYSVETPLRISLVGDDKRIVEKGNYNYDFTVSPGWISRGDVLDLSTGQIEADAKPGTKVIAEIHSTPIKIGEGLVDADGSIIGLAKIPFDIEAGYHEIHIKYTNFFGELVDRYRIVFVNSSKEDYDGDGIQNEVDPCPIGDQSYVDEDKDGIDDACDSEYVSRVDQKPIQQAETTSRSSSSNSISEQDNSPIIHNNERPEAIEADRSAVLSETDTGMAVTKFNSTGPVEFWVAISLGTVGAAVLLLSKIFLLKRN